MLIYHLSLLFLIFHQVVGKPFRFIDNVLQASESFLNESNFPSSLSVFPFWAIARENVQAISVQISKSACLIFSGIWVGMVQLKQ